MRKKIKINTGDYENYEGNFPVDKNVNTSDPNVDVYEEYYKTNNNGFAVNGDRDSDENPGWAPCQ